jgi:hypothetical protein
MFGRRYASEVKAASKKKGVFLFRYHLDEKSRAKSGLPAGDTAYAYDVKTKSDVFIRLLTDEAQYKREVWLQSILDGPAVSALVDHQVRVHNTVIDEA